MKFLNILKNKKSLILIVVLLLWIFLIFYFSNQNAQISTMQSRGIIEKLNILKLFKGLSIEKADLIFRKTAHFIVFLILSIIIFLLLKSKYNIKNTILITLLICLLVSCSDELHQLFISGRSCEFRDVLIDVSGSFIGILIIYLFVKNK